MPVRYFDGVNDELNVDIATADIYQGHTAAFLVRPEINGSYSLVYFLTNTTSLGGETGLGFGMRLTSGDATRSMTWWNGSNEPSITNMLASGVWQLLVFRKATGANVLYMSAYRFDTRTWIHRDSGASTYPDASSVAGGYGTFGNWGRGYWYRGSIAAVGMWNAPMSQSEVEMLPTRAAINRWPDVLSGNARALWMFNQASESTRLLDSIGTAHQKLSGGIVGTTALAENPPMPYEPIPPIEWTIQAARVNWPARATNAVIVRPEPTPLDWTGDRFLAELRRSHRVVTRLTVLAGGQEIVLPRLADGSVTLDANAATRGRCDVTIADDGLYVPKRPSDLLAPYGNELRIERGVQYADGRTEYAALGVYRIENVGLDDAGTDFLIMLTGLDRSIRIIDARFEAPYQIAAGTNYATAILQVLQGAWAAIPYQFATTTAVTPTLIAEEGADRWEFAQQMANSIGMELFFNGAGVCILRPVPSVSAGGTVAWEMTEGTNGVLLQAGRQWSREGTYNAVIATGQNLADGSAPPRGVAYDLNPNSPTYYYGPFGKKPRFYASEFLTTNDQCTVAAQGMLARELGTTQRVNFGSIVNPKLSPGDVILVTRERVGVQENNIVDTLTIPLSASNPMTGSTRATLVT